MASQSLTEYERKRLENIKRNDEMMTSLKLHSKALQLSSSTNNKRLRNESKVYKTSPDKKPKSKTAPIVIRCSLRSQGLPPETSFQDDNFSSPTKNSPKTPPPKSILTKLGPLTMKQAYMGDDSSASDRLLIDTVKDMSDNAPLNVKSGGVVVGNEGCLDLGSMILKPENIARVMPGKILNVKFFPCKDRTMIVAGNKFGNVVFWDVESEQDEGRNDGIYLYQPHRAPVSGFSIQPFSLSKVFSSCYDGFIRLLDFEKESFDLVYSTDGAIFSLSQRPQDPNGLCFSEGNNGMVNFWDTRVGKSSSSWMLHDSRINTIDFNPENTNLMATSSTDGSACIWDLRHTDARRPKYLKIVDHKRAVHSAYFSPTGSCLATTSLDDHVGILSGADFMNTSMVFHNNHTGRWISSFRAIWGWDDSYLFVGNMKRAVDVISTDRDITTLQSSDMSAIPCRFAAHPYEVGTLAAATSGGQIYVWTQS
ncbi:hypothetical protein IFM89_018544 [Coptis chinensis]|uniref:WD repeat-containing protein 76 n=1 Tax=Coptis chinensis TaxID=261450 RepID=A0A835IC15_9MAGN|nr:hypothetical protein IFM89_018544 [Coptis chinensis]